MKTIARFVTRGSSNDGSSGCVDLILGGGTKDGTLKPNMVYEIQEVLGELIIKEIGQSSLCCEKFDPKNLWGWDIGSIVECHRERWLLSVDEYFEYLNASNK